MSKVKKRTNDIKRELFEALGVKDEDEFLEIIYEKSEDVYTKTLGFQTAEGAYSDYLGSNVDPAVGLVKKYKDKYIIWIYGECVDGVMVDCDIEESEIYDSFEEAKEAVDNMHYGEKPIKEVIKEAKEKINEDFVYIDVKSGLYNNYYNVKYSYKLLIEKCQSLNPEEIREQINRYKSFHEKCDENGISIENIYKKPREWNNDQRYYRFEFFAGGKHWSFDAHIPSKMQRQKRHVLDFFDEKWMEEMTREAKKFAEQGGAICSTCGLGMSKADGCTLQTVLIGNVKYTRKRVEIDEDPKYRCGDCGVKPGYFHHLGCDLEPCPKCGGQMISCNCQ